MSLSSKMLGIRRAIRVFHCIRTKKEHSFRQRAEFLEGAITLWTPAFGGAVHREGQRNVGAFLALAGVLVFHANELAHGTHLQSFFRRDQRSMAGLMCNIP